MSAANCTVRGPEAGLRSFGAVTAPYAGSFTLTIMAWERTTLLNDESGDACGVRRFAAAFWNWMPPGAEQREQAPAPHVFRVLSVMRAGFCAIR